jgi:hypothetical protein
VKIIEKTNILEIAEEGHKNTLGRLSGVYSNPLQVIPKFVSEHPFMEGFAEVTLHIINARSYRI